MQVLYQLSYVDKRKNRLFRKHLSGKITKGVIFVTFDGLIKVSQAVVTQVVTNDVKHLFRTSMTEGVSKRFKRLDNGVLCHEWFPFVRNCHEA